jgi:hypothetical protein
MRQWHGPNAGHPGTDFRVRFEATPDGLWLQRLGEVIERPAHARLRAYPDLRAAADAAMGAHDEETLEADATEVALPTRAEGDDLFAVRAAGSSMDGGKHPIRDGALFIMRFARSASLDAVRGRVALVQIPGERFGSRFQVKRIAETDRGFELRSDNPDHPSYPATDDTVPIALLVEVVRPEDLAPPVGTVLAGPDVLKDAFALTEPPRSGRIDGHLFAFVEKPGLFEAPDRLRWDIDRRPGETL